MKLKTNVKLKEKKQVTYIFFSQYSAPLLHHRLRHTKNDWQAANTLSGSSWQSSWALNPEFRAPSSELRVPGAIGSLTRSRPSLPHYFFGFGLHAFDTFLRRAICPVLVSHPLPIISPCVACRVCVCVPVEAFGRTDCWRFDFGQRERALPLDSAESEAEAEAAWNNR